MRDKPTFVRTAVEAVTSRPHHASRSSIATCSRRCSWTLGRPGKAAARRRLGGAPGQRHRAHRRRDPVSRACSRPRRRRRRPDARAARLPARGGPRPRACAWSSTASTWPAGPTYFLGADTPVDEIADAAARLERGRRRAELVDALPPPRGAALRRRAQERELPHVDVWVGGPAFVARRRGLGRRTRSSTSTLCWAEDGPHGPTAPARAGAAGGLTMLSLRIAAPVPAQEPGAVHPHRRRHRRRHRRAGVPRVADHRPAGRAWWTRPSAAARRSPCGPATQGGQPVDYTAAVEGRHRAAVRDHDAGPGAAVLGHPAQGGQDTRAAAAHRRRARPARHDLRPQRQDRRRHARGSTRRYHRGHGPGRQVQADAGQTRRRSCMPDGKTVERARSARSSTSAQPQPT